ncbi:hypothetical protein [Aquabacterium sp.]|uniref:hypothetical protein n=1 Tax=Aquabacterium sp. TaxID=1872578 RepID=UPI0037845E74
MSIFARALAGAGEGMVSVAGKYLDEQLAINKAKAIEDLRLMSEQQMDQWRNSPDRRAALRDEALKDKQAEFDQGVQQQISEAGNTELTQAKISQANQITAGTAPTKAAAEGVITRAKSDNTAHVLPPGNVLAVGDKIVAQSPRLSPAEASLAAYREGLKGPGAGAVDKMSEAGKEQLRGIEHRDSELQKTIETGIANGSLSASATGPDGKPSPGYANYVYLAKQQQAIGLQRMRLLASEGVLDGKEAAEQLLASGPTGPDLEASVAQADRIGSKYARDFRAALEPALKYARSPEYMMQSIRADAERTGTKDYRVELPGVKTAVGNASWDTASGQARKGRGAGSESPDVAELRRLEDRVREANVKVLTYGSRQRQSDPRGFAQAQQELEAAKDEYRAAVDRTGIPPDQAVFRGPRIGGGE